MGCNAVGHAHATQHVHHACVCVCVCVVREVCVYEYVRRVWLQAWSRVSASASCVQTVCTCCCTAICIIFNALGLYGLPRIQAFNWSQAPPSQTSMSVASCTFPIFPVGWHPCTPLSCHEAACQSYVLRLHAERLRGRLAAGKGHVSALDHERRHWQCSAQPPQPTNSTGFSRWVSASTWPRRQGRQLPSASL